MTSATQDPQSDPYRESLPQVTTICNKCTHYRYDADDGGNCMATAHLETNFVTGVKFWEDIVTCKERNAGNCKLYEERPPPGFAAIWGPTLFGIVMIIAFVYAVIHGLET